LSAMSGPCLPGFVQRLDNAGHEGHAVAASTATRITILVSRRPTPLAHVDVDELMQLYAKGWSLKRIGQHFGVQPTSVYYRLRRAGVTLRPRTGARRDSPSSAQLRGSALADAAVIRGWHECRGLLGG
jgi:hypothetical protein